MEAVLRWEGGVKITIKNTFTPTFVCVPTQCSHSDFPQYFVSVYSPVLPTFCDHDQSKSWTLASGHTFFLAPVPALSATTSLQCDYETLVQSAPPPAQLTTPPVLVSQTNSATSVILHLYPVSTAARNPLASPASIYYVSTDPVARHESPVSATARTLAIVPGSSLCTTRSQQNFF